MQCIYIGVKKQPEPDRILPPIYLLSIAMGNPYVMPVGCTKNCTVPNDHRLCARTSFKRGNGSKKANRFLPKAERAL